MRRLVAVLLLLALARDDVLAQTSSTTAQGWVLTPAGQQVSLGDRPLSIVGSPDGKTLLIGNDGQSTQSLMVVDRATGSVIQTIAYAAPEALFVGLVFSPDGKHVYGSAGGNNKIRTYAVEGQQVTEGEAIALAAQRDGRKINPYPAGLAIVPDGNTLFIANNLDDSLSVLDLQTRTVTSTVPVGHNPYAALLTEDGKKVYVSNWGEQSVSVIDTTALTLQQNVVVGTHPSALALSSVRHELYVANTDSDSVSVIDTTT